MAVTQVIQSTKMVDTAIGAMSVTTSLVTGADIDDLVTSTVVSIATYYQMYNKASTANPKFTQNRRKVSIGGVTVGGY
jgi:hypothetical protein